MKLRQALKASGVAILMALTAFTVSAQNNQPGQPGQGGQGRRGGGNFDPAQFQQRMMERTKEELEITDDAEWKSIEPLVQKVMDARRESFAGFGRGRGGRGGRGGGPGGPGGGAAADPAAEGLQKAIDAKASNSELKAALAKYVASRKEKQAELEKAQADLRKVLTPRQEAIAALNGLL